MPTSKARSEEALRWVARAFPARHAQYVALRDGRRAKGRAGAALSADAMLEQFVRAYEKQVEKGTSIEDQGGESFERMHDGHCGIAFAVTKTRPKVRRDGLPTICEAELETMLPLFQNEELKPIAQVAIMFRGVFPESYIRRVRMAEDQANKES